MIPRISRLAAAFLCLLVLIVPSKVRAAEVGTCDSCQRLFRETPGMVIREIRITQRDVFDPSEGLPGWFPWQTVNRLHLRTAEQVIRDELLLREGDRLDPDLIQESRRNLRALDYFRDERIDCDRIDDRGVRVSISLREVWSLIPVFDIQEVEGSRIVTAGLTEQNLLGLGKVLSASYRKGAQSRNLFVEDSWRVRYLDPNVLGSRVQMAWTVQDLETGESTRASLERPFYSLETPWAAGASMNHARFRRRLIQNGRIVADYDREDNAGMLHFGAALRPGPPVVHRLEATYNYVQRRIRDFRPLSGEDPPPERPQDDTLSYPGIAWRRLGVNYIVERRIAQFERHEDFNLGNDLSLAAGFSADALGAARDEWIFSASDSQGYAFRPGHFALARAVAFGRLAGDTWRNTEGFFHYDHYLRDTPLDAGPLLHTFHLEGEFGYGVNLDPDRLLALGWDTGLRGYDADAFTGNKLLRVSLEDRIFASRRLLGLVALGLLLFWDSGYVWDVGQSIDLDQIRNDAGVGLRIALPQLSGTSVAHLTWGVPVGRGGGLRDGIVTFSTETGF
ncbi:MAG: POTRA domain-containing protein [bacterium]